MASFRQNTVIMRDAFVVIISTLLDQLPGHLGDEGLADRDLTPVIDMLTGQAHELRSATSTPARYLSIQATVELIAATPDPVGSMGMAADGMAESFARLQQMARELGLSYA